jgi:hypothetical protein
MHIWQTKQITKSLPTWDVKKMMANRPKGLKDDEWKEMVSNAKMEKLIVLNQVPKHLLKKDPRFTQDKE